jgi:hypothetical protein
MARPVLFIRPRRVNILIETSTHEVGKAKAKALQIRGGFSEYVSRLIAADRARKGRAIAKRKATA